MTKLIFMCTDHYALEPIDPDGRKYVKRIQPGNLVTVDVRMPRNYKLFNKYWAFCSFVLFHTSKFQSVTQVSDFIKIGVGHCHRVETRSRVENLPLSISWAKMDDLEFEKFWNRVCDFVMAEFMPHVTQPELEAQLAEFVGGGALLWRNTR